ncbi:MAG TPA: hypothetical protein VFV25_03090, partial [Methylibium sp.]
AAYWGAYTLGWLEDEARGAGRPFAADIYAISGVSGGSLGAAAFVAALASEQAALQQGGGHRAASLAGWMGELLGRDDLSPVVGMALFPDLVARLSPVAIRRFDRSQALELTWEQDTRRLARAAVGVDTPPWFACPLEALHDAPETCPGAKPAATPVPHLILNSASARSGRPALQASLDLQHPSAIGGRNPVFALDGLTLSGAVHNSARFPYLSPAGRVLGHNGASVDYWVDGGYFENSGVWALQALLHEMSKAEGFDAGVRARLRFIVFSNDPVHADSGSWLPQPPAPPPSGALAKPVPPRTLGGGVASQDRPILLAELFAPPEGLFTARAARADAEVLRLAALLRDDWQIEPTAVIRQLQLPATYGRAPSMNWFINHRSTCVMRSMVLARDECGAKLGGAPAPLPAQIASAPAYLRYRLQRDALHAEVVGR